LQNLVEKMSEPRYLTFTHGQHDGDNIEKIGENDTLMQKDFLQKDFLLQPRKEKKSELQNIWRRWQK